MTKWEMEYITNCKEWANTIPAVVAMNQAMKKERKKEIDISEWYRFGRTFPAK